MTFSRSSTPRNYWTALSLSFLLAVIVAVFIYRPISKVDHSPYPVSRSYTAVFEWDGTLKKLVLLDSATGREVENKELANEITTEVNRKLPAIVSRMRLNRAAGKLSCGVAGTLELYRINCSDPMESLPQDYDPDAKTPLMLASRIGDAIQVKNLILSGADINATDQHGTTALMRCAHLHNTSILKNLIDAGARVNTQDLSGRTALRYAVDGENVRAVDVLLASGADASLADAKGWTPLMNVTSVEMALALIAAGADVNAVNGDGETALMIAAEFGSTALVRVLLSHGANLQTRSKAGYTALDLATIAGKAAVVELLKSTRRTRDGKGQSYLVSHSEGLHARRILPGIVGQ
jgi:hypothetical protein